MTAIPRSPPSQPGCWATLNVSAGLLKTCPLRMMRTRPGRSVNQIVPSLPNARAQGALRPFASDWTLKLRGPGAASPEGLGLAATDEGDGERTGVGLCRAAGLPEEHATTRSARAGAIRRGIT